MNELKVTTIENTKMVSVKSLLDLVDTVLAEGGLTNFKIREVVLEDVLSSVLSKQVEYDGDMWLSTMDAIKFSGSLVVLPTARLNAAIFYNTRGAAEVGRTAFTDMALTPNGCEPFVFENGVVGVSSTYLHEVSKALGRTRRHDEILVKIRKYFKELEDSEIFRSPQYSKGLETSEIFRTSLNDSYYDLAEGEYKGGNGEMRPHLWMSKDLCLAIAGTEHKSIQMRIIDDLNRMQRMLEEQRSVDIVEPSLMSLLPGTVEHAYREKGLLTIGEARLLGFFPIAQVKKMWSYQHPGSEHPEPNSLYWKKMYRKLHAVTNQEEIPVRHTESHTGQGHTALFHLSVLKECFTDVDFSELEV